MQEYPLIVAYVKNKSSTSRRSCCFDLPSYRLEVLYPPPLLHDTSASGGYGVILFAIATQSRMPSWFNSNCKSFPLILSSPTLGAQVRHVRDPLLKYTALYVVLGMGHVLDSHFHVAACSVQVACNELAVPECLGKGAL